MKVGLSILQLLLIVALSSCREKDDPVLPAGAGSMVGKWEWVRSSGGFAGVEITPENTGEGRTIQYYSDGRFMSMSGDHFSSGTYTIETVDHSYHPYYITHNDIMSEEVGPYPYAHANFDGPDTLRLWEDCRDCFGHIYVRMR